MPEGRKYSTLEELERDFEQKLAGVDDPADKADIRVQMAEAKIDFRRAESEARMVDAWRRLALLENPAAAKFPELVVGASEEEIRNSAKEVATRVQSLAAREMGPSAFDQVREQANDLYGRAGAGGTGPGSQAPTTYVPAGRAEERWAQQFAERFNDAPKDMYGMRTGIQPAEVDRYVRARAIGHIQDRVRFWGQLTRSDYRG